MPNQPLSGVKACVLTVAVREQAAQIGPAAPAAGTISAGILDVLANSK